MSAVERALKKELELVKKKHAEIQAIMDATPLSRIIEIRQQAHEIMVAHDKDYAKIAKLIEPLAKEEKEMRILAKKQSNSIKLCDKLVELKMDIEDLGRALWRAERLK
jgi:allophanate hydrolase subunit 1